MEIERLVRMANDIARFFQAEPDHAEAVNGIVSHITRFWDPRMRREIVAHLETGHGEGLSDLALEAVKNLPVPATSA
jgi:formate dehydrogenase subunit delta